MMQLVKGAARPLPVSPEALAATAAGRGESPQLVDARLESLARFDAAAVGDNRYTRIALDWRALEPGSPVAPEGARAGRPPQHRPLARFLEQSPEAAARLFAPGPSPWDALAAAAWVEGDALVWERGARAAEPAWVERGNAGGLVAAPIYLEVGEGAEAQAVVRFDMRGPAGLHLTPVRGVVRAGATLKLVLISEGGEGHHALSLDLELMQDAKVELFGAWMGGKWTVARLRGRLAEPGASWTETQVAAGTGRDHHDWDTQVTHATRHTTSDVKAKTVLADRSRAVLTGNIKMEKESSGGCAALESHVLMLSPGARADSEPGLEIEALDVKASHAATIGQVDEDQMLYLMSRGMDEAQARRVVVVGFLEALLDRAPLPELREGVAGRIEAKIR